MSGPLLGGETVPRPIHTGRRDRRYRFNAHAALGVYPCLAGAITSGRSRRNPRRSPTPPHPRNSRSMNSPAPNG